MSHPIFSVVIPTRNRASILKRCLEYLAAQKDAPDFEVIVVNDGGTDNTKEIITNYELRITNLKYYEQPPSQQGVARNLGVEKARGEIVVFIGDDIFVALDWLARHAAAHAAHPEENVAVLGFSTWHHELEIDEYMRFLEKGWQFKYPALHPGFITEYPAWKFFYTSNISLKKAFFLKEHFDMGFKGYGWEDIELAYRLWKNHGLKMWYEPSAKAEHFHAFTEADLPKKMQQIGRASLYFQKQHPELTVMPRGWRKTWRLLFGFAFLLPLLLPFWKYGYYYFKSWEEFFRGADADEDSA